MTSIPLSKDEVSAFTPPSLENVVPKPIFRFRAPTARDQKRFGHLLTSEGLRLWPQETIREEVDRVLKENWSADVYARRKQDVENIWAMLDQQVEVSDAVQAGYAELLLRVAELSPLFRKMDADNRRFSDESPGIALSMYLCGWKNFDVPFELDGGLISFELTETIQTELKALEQRAGDDKVAGVVPGLAYMELTIHAFRLLDFNKEMEKNSPAPSTSSATRSGSRTTSRVDGASKPARKRTNSRKGKTQPASSPTKPSS